MKKVDIAIIGAGLAGIFAAYELVVQRPDLEVLLLEQGEPIGSRSCQKRGEREIPVNGIGRFFFHSLLPARIATKTPPPNPSLTSAPKNERRIFKPLPVLASRLIAYMAQGCAQPLTTACTCQPIYRTVSRVYFTSTDPRKAANVPGAFQAHIQFAPPCVRLSSRNEVSLDRVQLPGTRRAAQ
jgi:hypothetical protein